MNSKLGLEFSKCIHEVHDIGATTFVNVCDGTRSVVEWGVGDWIGEIFLCAVVIGLISVLGLSIYFTIKD